MTSLQKVHICSMFWAVQILSENVLAVDSPPVYLKTENVLKNLSEILQYYFYDNQLSGFGLIV